MKYYNQLWLLAHAFRPLIPLEIRLPFVVEGGDASLIVGAWMDLLG
jgi:hypothetical protein